MSKQEINLEQMGNMVSFVKTLGIKLTQADKAIIAGKLLIRQEICNHEPNVHGGAIMALADALGAFGAWLNMPEGCGGTTTTESKTNFIRPALVGDTLHGKSRPLSVGRRLSVWQTEINRDDGKLVAQVTQTQLYLWPLAKGK
ncbi:MAG: PaaI family thioesterase [Parvibaculales bacterium]